MPNKKQKVKERYNLTLTPCLVAAADRMSFQDMDSRSSFVDKLIAKEAERRGIKVQGNE